MNSNEDVIENTDDSSPSFGRRCGIFASIAIVGLAFDLWSKSYMFSKLGLPGKQPFKIWWIIEDFFGFQTAVNQGALFGIGQGKSSYFAMFSGVALLAIAFWFIKSEGWKSRWLTVCLAAVTAGILGNLYDRLGLWHPTGILGDLYDYLGLWRPVGMNGLPTDTFAADYSNFTYGVRDFILFTYQGHIWPNFNIADCLLVCGAIMLGISSFRQEATDKQSKTTENEMEAT
ncbi:MAG: signal peptidase II [Planctomycetaceae bacterium]|jgi:signal peptidase II|nr:signal peptidase II [Planctomycetaceae bacterium]MBT4723899.1 signal peptidase II [Planctomycetaceae bacterium]MBT5598791.1 signal peptidase II [Planctomycetaceae bacterium]MBT6849125.1 signal peptidase II [Planctomycetaceae bacterium]MBT7919459.1 signal peptidase II [Planctomycetaceae bacterium]